MPTSSNPVCPYCEAADVKALAGGYGLWKCRVCGERFDPYDDEDDTPERIRTKFKPQRYGEDAW